MIAALAALLFVACSETSPVSTPKVEAPQLSVEPVSGDAQTGVAGEMLPAPLVVQADIDGRHAGNELLTWVVVEGGGSVYAGTSRTDQQGFAREWWTLGEAGDQRIEVRAVDASTGEKRLYAVFEAEAVEPEDDGEGGEDRADEEDSEDDGENEDDGTDGEDDGTDDEDDGTDGEDDGTDGEDDGSDGEDDGSSSTVASVTLAPSDVELEAGNAQQLTASASDSEGDAVEVAGSEYEWASSDESVATVTGNGVVSALAAGEAVITATLDEQAGEAAVVVTEPEEDHSHDEDDSDGEDDSDHGADEDFGEWDYILADTTVVGDVVVPADEAWLIGANVEVEGNVRTVDGTIAMRPGSSLKFLGADPEQYVGGGMAYSSQFADDIGMWVDGTGQLDIRGTPKQGWNRTGTHSSWSSDDEYWIAPTDEGDYQPRRWYPGDPIPQVDPRAPAAEVMNVTRDIVIEGPGHIHIHSRAPQRIEYVRLEGLGVSREGGPVLGRYALHMHHGGWDTQGTIIQGVAAVNSKGRVFVPHESHGITMVDNVSVNSFGEAFWWDVGDHTNDLLVDRLVVSGVHMPRSVSGETSRKSGIVLPGGTNVEIRNSAVSGARNSKLSVGFDWPEGAFEGGLPPVWTFDTGNVAHNNSGPGLRFWTNRPHAHVVRDAVSYRNGSGGSETGAYINSVQYEDVLLLGNGIRHHSASRTQEENGRPATYERVHVVSPDGPAVSVGHLRLLNESDEGQHTEFIDCTLESAPGHPKVMAGTAGDGGTRNPWFVLFRRCGLEPGDIEFPEEIPDGMEGTSILIEHEDGRKWEIVIQNGQREVTELEL